MKPKQIQITVTSPCHEKWSDMTSTDHGAFCRSCSREVIDFSRMTDREVIEYLSTHQAGCGRFRRDQVEAPLTMAVVDNGTLRWRALLLGLLPMLAWRALPAAAPPPVLTDQTPAPTSGKKNADTTITLIPDTISVCGRVMNYERQPLADVEVAVHYPAGGQTGSGTRTDSNGFFELSLAAAEYKYGVPYLRIANDRREEIKHLNTAAMQNHNIYIDDGELHMVGGMSMVSHIITRPGKENIITRIARAIHVTQETAASHFAVYGTVWDGGRPLRDVSIRVIDSAGIFYGNGAVTDTSGGYSIQISKAEQAQRQYYLEYDLNGHYRRRMPLTKATTQRLDLSLPSLARYPNMETTIEDISLTRLVYLKMKWRMRQLAAKLHLGKKRY
ncbi:MAG: carboxypeptidase regulatory-like domain-containing protein [Bacteroidetes bacterium]|nr:carboxypeptidase regulatory-like domain-containing protein [Bacteroidota bacterium]